MYLEWFRHEKPPQDLIDSGLCCLYAARAGKNVVKVSTSRSIAKRMRLLQGNCHLFVTLDAIVWLETCASAKRAEDHIHALLDRSGQRLRGDWYKIDPEAVVAAFNALCQHDFVMTPHAMVLDRFSS